MEICLSTGFDHQNLSFQGDNIEALRKPDKDQEILVNTISVTAREETREMKPEPSVQGGEQKKEEGLQLETRLSTGYNLQKQVESKRMRPWLKQVSEAEGHVKVEESAGPLVPGMITMEDNRELAPKIKILWIIDRGKQLQESNFSIKDQMNQKLKTKQRLIGGTLLPRKVMIKMQSKGESDQSASL